MSRRDDHVGIADMLSHASEAVDLLGEISPEQLTGDRVMQLALVQLVGIVGEAANRVSQTTQQRHPEILWAQIIGMRNRLVHGYDVIDLNILWDTITDDLPSLIAALEDLTDQE